MRYNEIDTISFTNKDGNSFPIKDIRPIPNEAISLTIPVIGDILLDEVASRQDIWGDLAEDQSYRIFDANIVRIVENNFDVIGLSGLKIPV